MISLNFFTQMQTRYKLILAIGMILIGSSLLFSCAAQREEQTDRAAKQTYEWKMVTSWPKNFPGLGTAANKLAQLIEEMSDRRLIITVYGGGELVGPLEVFDAVARGTAEMGHSSPFYWQGKSEAAQLFTAMPFGLTAQEKNAWLYYGGGMELWEKTYAKFNLVPLAAGNTGVQMGGWFNKEINSIADLRGLKTRIPGLGGSILTRAGAITVTLPGAELFSALQSGAIDAAEWVGPYNDLALGLYKVAKYYYYPGWQEPSAVLEAMVNKDAFDSLPPDLQSIVIAASRVVNDETLSEFTANNNLALQTLIAEHEVEMREFPQEVLTELARITEEEMNAISDRNPEFKEVYESIKEFRARVMQWHEYSENSYMKARREALR